MFDGLPTKFEPAITLDRPSAEALSYVLRHRELWPKGFEWDYGRSDKCAIGLAAALWGTSDNKPGLAAALWRTCRLFRSSAKIGKTVGLPPLIVDRIFYNLHWALHIQHQQVTPYHVADAIDAYQTGRRISHV